MILLDNPGGLSAGLRMLSKGAATRRESLAGLAGIVRMYIENGTFHPVDVERTTQIIWSSMYGMTVRFLIEHDVDAEQRKALMSHLTETLVKGLRQ